MKRLTGVRAVLLVLAPVLPVLQAGAATVEVGASAAQRAMAVSGPILSITPLAHDFGVVRVGASVRFDFVVSNPGDEVLDLQPPVSSDDQVTVTLPESQVPPGATIAATVTYTPALLDAMAATLTFPSNAANGPWEVNVAGRAVSNGPSLLVTSQLDHSVKEYDAATGAYVWDLAGGVGDPLDAIVGADGNLLVTDGQQDAVKRFDWATGAYLGVFADAVSPGGMTVAGGRVYVCQGNSPQVVRSFDAVTGTDAGSFIPTVGPNPGPRDVKVAHDRLYVCYWNLGTVEMFDLATRESLGLLFPPGTGGLSTPWSMAFGPDGDLYVSYVYYVNRYHPTTGEFLGRFVDTGDRTGRRYAVGIAWGPDGNLYVATQNDAGVQRYDGISGAYLDDFVPVGGGGLTAPFHISFTQGPPATLEADLTLEPGVLNLASRGSWITAFIQPQGFDPAKIDVPTLRLAGSVPAESKFANVTDHDLDGIPELMVKFSRETLAGLLTPGVQTLELTGSLLTGERFHARGDVKVIDPPTERPAASVAPNPLNPVGVLTLRLPVPGPVTVKVFDLQGRLVRTIMEREALPAGAHGVPIDGTGQRGETLASGVYLYRVETARGVFTGRFLIVK